MNSAQSAFTLTSSILIHTIFHTKFGRIYCTNNTVNNIVQQASCNQLNKKLKDMEYNSPINQYSFSDTRITVCVRLSEQDKKWMLNFGIKPAEHNNYLCMNINQNITIIKRPGVARAVLLTVSLLIHSVSKSAYSSISL